MHAEAPVPAPPEVYNTPLNEDLVRLEIAREGAKIPIDGRVENIDSYTGPREFDVVVDFRDLFVKKGIWASLVPWRERWHSLNTPDGIAILGFYDPEVAGAIEEISWIAAKDFYGDEDDCVRYYNLNKFVFQRMAERTGLRRNRTEFLGLIRAGVVAGEMLGISADEQILIQTKRLHLIGEKPGEIAIGITPEDRERLRDIDGKHLLIADPAGATYGSVIGNLIYLRHLGIKPSRVSIWNTVASHKGSLFALEAMKALGIEGEIFAGGYSPSLNSRYYLETEAGGPSVRDAGDGLDRFLPERLRLRTI